MQSSTKAEAIRKLEALGLKSKAEQTAIRAQQKTEAAAAALHSSADLQAKIEEAQKSYHLKETHDAEGRATGQRRTIAGAEWDHAGHKPGIEVWRIENFHVVGVDPKSYGQFYDGDSYIVLQTRKVEDKFVYDIFFWLGENTTQDEAGIAAYKTVELDDKFGGLPVQHREVQGFESKEFLNCFNGTIRIMAGGIESGFHHVTPESYRTRLLHVKGKTRFRVEEKPLTHNSLNSGDTFLLDAGLKLFVWQGKSSNGGEKHKAIEIANAIRDEREGSGVSITIHTEGEESDEFWTLVGGKGPVGSADAAGDDFAEQRKGVTRLCKLSDAGGELTFTEVASGEAVKKDLLRSEDVFVFDSGSQVFAWVGKNASAGERKNALIYAQDYLKKFNRPPYLSIAKVYEGGENEVFNNSFY
jgi:hypothetical protein